jgi:hypothetical protein
MPTYNRRYLRQRLGRDWLRDTIVGTVTLPCRWRRLSSTPAHADPTMSGEQMYFRHWLRLTGPDGVIHDTRVASFGCAVGDAASAYPRMSRQERRSRCTRCSARRRRTARWTP